jgi:hypothetical protein
MQLPQQSDLSGIQEPCDVFGERGEEKQADRWEPAHSGRIAAHSETIPNVDPPKS